MTGENASNRYQKHNHTNVEHIRCEYLPLLGREHVIFSYLKYFSSNKPPASYRWHSKKLHLRAGEFFGYRTRLDGYPGHLPHFGIFSEISGSRRLGFRRVGSKGWAVWFIRLSPTEGVFYWVRATTVSCSRYTDYDTYFTLCQKTSPLF